MKFFFDVREEISQNSTDFYWNARERYLKEYYLLNLISETLSLSLSLLTDFVSEFQNGKFSPFRSLPRILTIRLWQLENYYFHAIVEKMLPFQWGKQNYSRGTETPPQNKLVLSLRQVAVHLATSKLGGRELLGKRRDHLINRYYTRSLCSLQLIHAIVPKAR